ncbi:MAG: phosphoribosylanthranilate isomerase [Verrucomicrobiota bacterium]
MSVKVKICGLTSVDDALAAAAAGADMIGLMFHPASPRFVQPQTATSIAAALPPYVAKVGVFVNAPEKFVRERIADCGLNLLQFHGDETPEYCLRFGIMTVKAFRIRNAASLEALDHYPTDAWLLDAYTPGKEGGTGETFDWELAKQANQKGRPIFLAGGLTPANVARAVAQVQPFAVDVSSGVESSPGKKNPELVAAFIRAAKGTGV